MCCCWASGKLKLLYLTKNCVKRIMVYSYPKEIEDCMSMDVPK